MKRFPGVVFLVLGVGLGAGCASNYVARTGRVRAEYERYQHERALELLAAEFKDGGANDRLLVLFDRGMLLHAAGRFDESIKVLDEADQLAQEMDHVSISEEAATLISNERHRAYRGEDFERLMISTLQALNYAQLGKDEDALVEVRRVNERILKMVSDEKKPYEQLAIARYLGGVLYEDQGELDSAIIDYLAAEKLAPGLGHLAEPVLRLAKETGRDDAYQALRRRYPDVPHEPLKADEGQVVVVVEAGRAPEKESASSRDSRNGAVEVVAIPAFRSRGSAPRAVARVQGTSLRAVTVTSIDAVAKTHLNDRIGRILARSVASTAVKAGLAVGAAALTRSEEVGVFTFWLLSLTTQPDLRSWQSLPAEFQLVRMRLPVGKQQLSIEAGGRTTQHEVTVRPRRVSLVVVRRY